MGHKIHVHTRHEIVFGTPACFNLQAENLEKLLKDNGATVGCSVYDDCVGDWEIDRNEFLRAIERIKGMDARELSSRFDADYAGSNPEVFKRRVCRNLRTFARTGDHRDGYYHFSWF